ncbi:sensor histidine kinase [Candidatus Uhrbacteria bacterium]|nr:sensor histidine kinase [Candidatus Uhrbacteria bacterium]
MEITCVVPEHNTLEETLKELQRLTEQFQSLRRNEEHWITIDAHRDPLSFLPALTTLLSQQKQREGYLIQITAEHTQGVLIDPSENATNLLEQTLAPLEKIRPDIRTTILYIIGELIDNLHEHAQTPLGIATSALGQERFSLTVADMGVSIPNAYRQSHIAVSDECEALRKALNGISTKTVEERGTGLPSIQRAITQLFNGELWLISASAALRAHHDVIECHALPFFWQGTIAHLQSPLPQQSINLYDILR